MVNTVKKTMTKTEMVSAISEAVELDKKQVQAVLDQLVVLATKALGKKGSGVFKVDKFVQLKRVDKPAKAARRGIDPFTKKERDFPAQPAKSVVKVAALKYIKDAVA